MGLDDEIDENRTISRILDVFDGIHYNNTEEYTDENLNLWEAELCYNKYSMMY